MDFDNVNNMVKESPVKGNPALQDGSDPDFVWEDYLEDTKAVAAPPTAFTHVEYSLESGFKVGMKLEIPSSDDNSSYWMVSVIMTCGELLSLRFVGYGEDRSADFWFNIKSGKLHPVGWCSANKKMLRPPKGLLEKYPDVTSLLTKEINNIDTSTPSLSEDLAASFMPIDQIKNGMKLEVLEKFNPQHIWIATIIQNVGGRLLLKYDGIESDTLEEFWLFYLSDRLQPVGFGRENSLQYVPPKALCNFDGNIDDILNKLFEEANLLPFPAHIFEPKLPVEPHEFKEGMKLEAVNPKSYTDICPATVSKIINEYYFIVTIDGEGEINESSLCCHNNSPLIFPINWAEENEIVLKAPSGYAFENKFSWVNYLSFCKADPAPAEFFQMNVMNMGFESDMKCEAADPFSLNKIKAVTIKKIKEPLMWLHFDTEESEHESVITSLNSFDLYPVGWCASNSYPLHTPINYKPRAKFNVPRAEAVDQQDVKLTQQPQSQSLNDQHGKQWCPKIYFNHRCFTGPLLSKSRLAELPQAIGPGPIRLVIHEVITKIISIAYKSSQVLSQLDLNGNGGPSMQRKIMKPKNTCKYVRNKEKILHNEIVTPRNTEEVESFCKMICKKLECCPFLFGPVYIEKTCPHNCHTLTKTKFGYNFVKKQKKLGRPPLSNNASNPEEVVKRGPGRRKKRKHWTHLLSEFNKEKKIKSNNSSETDESQKCQPENREKKESVNNAEKLEPESDTEKCDKEDTSRYSTDNSSSGKIPLIGKKKLKHTPSSSIVTRGAKLPNFGIWHHLSTFHSKRGRPRTRPIRSYIPGRRVGRPPGSTKKAIAAAAHLKAKRLLELEDDDSKEIVKEQEPQSKVSKLESSPLDWTVEEVVKYLQKTECAPLAPLIKDQEIDGQALLMLNQVNVREHLHLKPEPAKKFCYLVKHLKLEFFSHYAH